MSPDDFPKAEKSVVITDLDNTLYDWVGIWFASFSAMLEAIITKSGIARLELTEEIQAVHRKHGTTEYAFLIEELPALRKLYPDRKLCEVFNDAVEAYRLAREENLCLYPGIRDSLSALKDRGCLIVGFTESMAFYTNHRVKALDLDGILDVLYCPKDHGVPGNLTREQAKMYPTMRYDLDHTVLRYTPPGEVKPTPHLLLSIIDDIGINREDAVYVGDSVIKDVAMAQVAGVADVHAQYGVSHHKQAHDLLRAVTHWPQEDTERNAKLTEKHITPTNVLKSSYGELLDQFEFHGRNFHT